MSKFDVEAAIREIWKGSAYFDRYLQMKVREQLRAAVLAGREDARDVVLSTPDSSAVDLAVAIRRLSDP